MTSLWRLSVVPNLVVDMYTETIFIKTVPKRQEVCWCWWKKMFCQWIDNELIYWGEVFSPSLPTPLRLPVEWISHSVRMVWKRPKEKMSTGKRSKKRMSEKRLTYLTFSHPHPHPLTLMDVLKYWFHVDSMRPATKESDCAWYVREIVRRTARSSWACSGILMWWHYFSLLYHFRCCCCHQMKTRFLIRYLCSWSRRVWIEVHIEVHVPTVSQLHVWRRDGKNVFSLPSSVAKKVAVRRRWSV